MKRKYKIILVSVIIILLAASVFSANYLFFSKTNINDNNVATLNYSFQDNDISVSFTQEDMEQIRSMFNDKDVFYDPGISCPFNDYLSISFGTGIFKNTFYPSCDCCHTIKYRSKIFYLSEKEGDKLRNILGKYGVSFPCF